MRHVFISYSGKSEGIAAHVMGALKGLGAAPFIYRRPDRNTALDTDTLAKLRQQCEASSFFIQILQGSAGVDIPAENKPILQLETEWFLQERSERGERRPLPLVISLEAPGTDEEGKRFGKFVDWLEENGIGVQYCSSSEEALEVAVGWFARMRGTPTEVSIVDGHLDVEVGEPGIGKAIEEALLHDRLIPQKLLYATPVGALLWHTLSTKNETRVRKLFDTFRFDVPDTPCVKKVIQQVSQWHHADPLSVIALGCGSGRREATFALTVAEACPHRKCRVLMVDVSKTLLAKAAVNFDRTFSGRNRPLGLEFALADFEHPTTLSTIMQTWCLDKPVVVLFLGNTLGNIDFRAFMATLGAAMKPADLLVAEVVVASDWEILATKKTGWQNPSPQTDERFEFVCGPVRTLGITPELRNYRFKVEVGEYSITRTYAYSLSDTDVRGVAAIANVRQYAKHLLQLVRVDAFIKDPLSRLAATMFDVIDFDVKECERVFAAEHRAQMGVFVASKRA
jgi:hypothetical protein